MSCTAANYQSLMESNLLSNIDTVVNDPKKPINPNVDLSGRKRSLLSQKLLAYRSKLAHNVPHEQLVTGLDISSGLSRSIIVGIVKNITNIDSLETLQDMFKFYDPSHAKKIWEKDSDLSDVDTALKVHLLQSSEEEENSSSSE